MAISGTASADSLSIGTPFSGSATKALLCGSGELGKEVAIELKRMGLEVIALDRYDNAPAMQVADRSYTLSMLDGPALREIIEREQPDYVIPEIEAIATDTLVELEAAGVNIVSPACASHLTMNRDGIRCRAGADVVLTNTSYRFASPPRDLQGAGEDHGTPVLEKPTKE